MNPRGWVFRVHRVLGLALGVYVAVIGLTGSALVFRPEVERSLVPAPAAGRLAEATPFQNAWRNLRQMYPEHAIGPFSLYQYPGTPPDAPFRVRLQRGSWWFFVYADSATGRVLAPQHPWVRSLQDLHFNLLGGRIGLLVNALGAILLALMCVTGAIVWWPLRWRSSSLAFRRVLHRQLGAATFLLLAAVAAGGVYLAWITFAGYDADVVAWQSGVSDWPTPLDAIVSEADRVVPDGRRMAVALPGGPAEPFRVDKVVGGSLHRIFLEQSTGEVIRVARPAGPSLRGRAIEALELTHYGRFAGYWSRVAWIVLGLAPLVLFVTGVAVWWSRRRE